MCNFNLMLHLTGLCDMKGPEKLLLGSPQEQKIINLN